MTETVFVCHRHFNEPRKMGIFEYRVTNEIYDPQLIAKIIHDYHNYMSQPEIANKHQVTYKQVKTFFSKNNLQKLPKRYELEIDIIVDKYVNQHKNTYEIAKEYNCASYTIGKLLSKKGVKMRTGGESQMLACRQKLDIKQILDGYVNQRKSTYELGREYNCSHTLIIAVLLENGISLRTRGEAKRKHFPNEHFFDQIDNEIKAYILGFLYADGYNSERYNRVDLTLAKKDVEILEKIRDVLCPNYPLRNFVRAGREFVQLLMASKHMSETLVRQGCPQAKTFKLVFPTFIPKDLVRHFIRGYSDGDGCITFTNRNGRQAYYHIMVGAESFINSMAGIFKTELDAHSSILKATPARDNNIKIMNVGGNRQVKRVLDWLYQDATIFMQRKYERYLGLCRQCAETDIKLAERGRQPYVAKLRTNIVQEPKPVPDPIIVPIPKIGLKLVIVANDDDTTKSEPDNANHEDDIEFDENLELEPDEDELKFDHDAIRMDDDDLRYGDDRFDYENLELEPDEDELDDDQLEDA
jgi:intein-encoded DNA endonuclease-like protein